MITQVLDARDPNGTRCNFLEQHIRKHLRHKHIILLLNKCDLVSLSVAVAVLCVGWLIRVGSMCMHRAPCGNYGESLSMMTISSEDAVKKKHISGISLA